MANNLIIKDEAIADAHEAYLYYADRSAAIAEKFKMSLKYRLDQIVLNPEHYSFIDKRKYYGT